VPGAVALKLMVSGLAPPPAATSVPKDDLQVEVALVSQFMLAVMGPAAATVMNGTGRYARVGPMAGKKGRVATAAGGVHELTREEAWELVDRQTKRYFNLSAQEFVDAWKAGRFKEVDEADVVRLGLLVPLLNE